MSYHISINQKIEVAILTSNKVGFRAKKITRDKDGYYIMIKESIHQDYTAILNSHQTTERQNT